MHRYLTGQYAKVDSFTGRHKKEVCYDGQSHLLLIRNETGPPDLQVFNILMMMMMMLMMVMGKRRIIVISDFVSSVSCIPDA